MSRHIAIFSVLAALGCVAVLVGCDSKERDQARAEAQQAKAKLAEATQSLADTLRDRDGLRESFDKLSLELGEFKSQVTALTEARDQLAEQVKSLTEARDAAVAMAKEAQTQVEKLTAQVKTQLQKVTQMQTENSKLQVTIKELQDRLKDVKLPSLPGV